MIKLWIKQRPKFLKYRDKTPHLSHDFEKIEEFNEVEEMGFNCVMGMKEYYRSPLLIAFNTFIELVTGVVTKCYKNLDRQSVGLTSGSHLCGEIKNIFS